MGNGSSRGTDVFAAKDALGGLGQMRDPHPRLRELRGVKVDKTDNGYTVTLSGNGALLAAKVDEAKDPERVLLDFHGVATGTAPALTNVKNDDINRIRVATNSREPLITRVVIDLAKKIPYTVEQVGDDLRVMFRKAMETAAAAVAPAAAPAVEEKPETTAAAKAEPPVDVPADKPVVVANEAAVSTPAPEPTPAPAVAAPVVAAPAPSSIGPSLAAPISQTPLPVPTPCSIVSLLRRRVSGGAPFRKCETPA